MRKIPKTILHPEAGNPWAGKLWRIDKFWVPGTPIQKGKPRFYRAGKFVRTYTPTKTSNYENLVTLSHHQAVGKTVPWEGPVTAEILAVFQTPKSRPKWFREACDEAYAAGQGVPVVKSPDADNLVKAVLDALNGIAYTDDRQVFSIWIRKVYGPRPGAQVILYCYEGPKKETPK